MWYLLKGQLKEAKKKTRKKKKETSVFVADVVIVEGADKKRKRKKEKKTSVFVADVILVEHILNSSGLL